MLVILPLLQQALEFSLGLVDHAGGKGFRGALSFRGKIFYSQGDQTGIVFETFQSTLYASNSWVVEESRQNDSPEGIQESLPSGMWTGKSSL